MLLRYWVLDDFITLERLIPLHSELRLSVNDFKSFYDVWIALVNSLNLITSNVFLILVRASDHSFKAN